VLFIGGHRRSIYHEQSCHMRGFTTDCPQICVQDNVMDVDGKLIHPGRSQEDTML
jgi:hypothetical protein